jgi:hypothetical protein
LWPPPSGAPSIATTWLLDVSARKVIPSPPVQRTVQSISLVLRNKEDVKLFATSDIIAFKSVIYELSAK